MNKYDAVSVDSPPEGPRWSSCCRLWLEQGPKTESAKE